MMDISETDDATALVTVSKDSSFVIQIGEFEPVAGHLGDTVSTSLGRISVKPTWALRELYYDNPITVRHRNINAVAESYRSRVSVSRNSSSDGIINLSLHDTSPQRAADILNEMIAVYNENTVEEKKEIIRQTSEYINSRITQLDHDLGAQESQIASFKRDNQILNLNDYGQSYLSQSIETQEEINRINAQISHAQYLQQLTIRQMLTMETCSMVPTWFKHTDPDRTHLYLNENDAPIPGGMRFKYDSSGSQVLSSLVEKLSALDAERPVFYEIAVRETLSRIWEVVYRRMPADSKDAPHGRMEYERVKKMLDYIEQHYAENVRLSGISEEVLLCESECCRLFKRYMNMTIIEYLNNYRIDRSIESLADTDLSVTEIALMSGFSDPNYYSKMFSARKGVSPRKYRKRFSREARAGAD
jgi:AraC-like DNA-binding protein